MEIDKMGRRDNNTFTKRRFAQKIRTRMKTEDAKYHKFLWEDENTVKIAAYQMNKQTFGNVCSPFIATYVIQKTAKDHGDVNEKSVTAIKDNLYMDDYLGSARTKVEAITLAKRVKAVLAEGDFHFVKWQSNSASVRNALEPSEVEPKEDHNLSQED